MIKNIIFDIGGVVVKKGKFNAILKAFARITFSTTNPEFFKEEHINKYIKQDWEDWRLGKINAEQFFNKQRRRYHLKISTNKMAYFLYHSQKPNKEIIMLIKSLKKQFDLYAITNHTREWFQYQKKKYNYDDLFLGILTSFEAKSAKPNISIYKRLLKTYNLNPEECLLIDDQRENLIPAEKLGMKTILFTKNTNLKHEINKLPK
ncbi:MAG: HAD family phosphatase [Nanoarchaeota archaeon]